MKLKASLEAVQTRKDISDNIIYMVKFSVYPQANPPAEVGVLQTFYKKPIEIEITEVKQ
jgi:hypothetical protein